MRIQGELLKLGIGVSPTTIAAVLRSSGLGPAPRRIGPTWSEFLRAQAHSMLGGGLRDSLDGYTFEPSGWAADREARQVEADDNVATEVVGPQLASQPLPVRSRQALPRQWVLPATRRPSRLQPSHRSHARDGPKSRSAACPTTKCSGTSVRTHRRSHPATRAKHRVGPPRQSPRILSAARCNRSTTVPSCQGEPSFFTPTGSYPATPRYLFLSGLRAVRTNLNGRIPDNGRGEGRSRIAASARIPRKRIDARPVGGDDACRTG
jgi:hypothetical protein